MRLAYIYGKTDKNDLILDCVNAVNESPTSRLAGLTPCQVQFARSPSASIQPDFPEDKIIPVVAEAARGSYEIRCHARAEIEKLRADKIFIEQMRKLAEQARSLYPEAEMLKEGDAAEFYDKDKKAWLGPAEVLHLQQNPNSTTFIIDFKSDLKRINASHIRRHLSLDDMLFPPQILRVVSKTHGIQKNSTEEKSDFETRVVQMQIGQTGQVPESASSDKSSGVDSVVSEDKRLTAESRTAPCIDKSIGMNTDAAPTQKTKSSMHLTKNYADKIFEQLQREENKKLKEDASKNVPVRGKWRLRKEARAKAIHQLVELVKAQPEAEGWRHAKHLQIAEALYKKCQEENLKMVMMLTKNSLL